MKPRQRKCKTCGLKFDITFPNVWWCSPDCGTAMAMVVIERQRKKNRIVQAERERSERKKHAERKLAVKPRSYWINQAQQAVNAYVRERDADLPCVSCRCWQAAQWDAGHYRTTAAAPQLRFNPLNINKQCSVCNQHKSGNTVPYRVELIKRIGIEAIEALESNHDRHRWTIDECKAIKAEYRQKLKDLIQSRQGAA